MQKETLFPIKVWVYEGIKVDLKMLCFQSFHLFFRFVSAGRLHLGNQPELNNVLLTQLNRHSFDLAYMVSILYLLACL